MSDVAVTFGAETGDLEAALASANAEIRTLSSEMRSLANEMEKAGASADASLGQRLKAMGADMAEAKKHASELKTELKSVGDDHGEGGNPIEKMLGSLKNILGPVAEFKAGLAEIAELVLAAFAVEKFVEFAKSMGELGEATERTSKMLGVTTEQVGELNYIAAMTGTATDNLTLLMGRFNGALPEAATGAGKVAAGLRSLGLSARELQGMNPAHQLEAIASAVSKFKDSQNKLGAVADLGHGFVELLPLLDEGKEGFEKLKTGADDAGVKLNETSTGALVDMQHAMVNLGQTTEGLTIAAFKPFIGVVTGASDILTGLAKTFTDSANSGGVVALIMDDIAVALRAVETGVLGLTTSFETWSVIAEGAAKIVATAFLDMGKEIGQVFVDLAKSIPAFFTALITAGVEAVKGLAAQFVDLGTLIEDTLSLKFGAAKADFGKFGEDASASLGKVGDAFKNTFDFSDAEGTAHASANSIKAIADDTANKLVDTAKRSKDAFRDIWGLNVQSDEKPDLPQNPPPVEQKRGGKGTSGKDAEQAYSGDVQAAQDAEKDIADTLNNELKTHKITMSEWLKQTNEALDGEALAVINAADKAMASAALSSQQKVAIAQKEAHELEQIARQESDAQAKAAEESAKSWKSGADTISGLMNSQVDGILKGTTSVSQAFKNMAASAIEDIIKFCVKWLAEHIATEASVVAAHASGVVATKAVDSTSISGDAARAAAGAYAAVAGVPLIGPVLAPAAAAVAFGAVEAFGSFDAGAMNISHDQLAMVHAGEVVVPQRGGLADGFREMAAGGGFGKNVSVNPQINIHNNSIDSRSLKSMFNENGGAMAKAIHQASRHGAMLGLKGALR